MTIYASANGVPQADILAERVPPNLSIVLPIRNQRAMIVPRYDELRATLDGQSFEIIAVDDGSIDGSFAVLRDLAARDSRLRVVRLRRQFGQSAALMAGFERAGGTTVVTIDADGQTDPADIARLVAEIDAGYDLVNGARTSLTSRERVGSRLITRATRLALADYGSPLKAYRAHVAHELHLYGDLYRFIPAIANWQGAKLKEIPVATRHPRNQAHQIGLWQSAKLLLDMITVRFMLNYAHRPMQSIGRIGGVFLTAALAVFAYLAVVKFGLGQDIGDRPLLLLAVLLAAVSVQVLVLGLLAELMIRVYYEVQGKPIYAIHEIVDAGAEVMVDVDQKPIGRS